MFSERTSDPERSSWLASLSIAALFLALGLVLSLRPYLTGRLMPGDSGDARFNLAILEFFSRNLHALLHGGVTHFRDAPFFFPWPRVTNFSDTFWGDGEVYALFRWLGAGPLAAFRFWFVAGFVLTYGAAFLSFRKFGLGRWGAATGAFLFTFPLPMAAQFAHAQLVYRLWVPPALAAFDVFLSRASLRAGAATLLFVALQLIASIYIGFLLCLLLFAYLIANLLVARERLALPNLQQFRIAPAGELVTVAVMIAAALVVLAIVGIPYHEVQSLYGFKPPWSEVAGMLPRPGSYLLTNASRFWPNLSHLFSYPDIGEHQIFPGLAALIALAWFTFSKRARKRNPLTPVMLVSFGVLVALTLDADGHTLYWFIHLLPGFSAMRAITRVILVMMLPLAFLFGLLIDRLADHGNRRTARGLGGIVLSGFMVFECAFVAPDGSNPVAWNTSLAGLMRQVPKALPPDAILAVRSPPRTVPQFRWVAAETNAELAAVMLGVQTVNGYSGNMPNGWDMPVSCAEVGHDIRLGREFLAEHGFAHSPITADRLVLVGFSGCDPAAVLKTPVLTMGRAYHFAAGRDGSEFAGHGFSRAESWGRWTDGKNAFLFFALSQAPKGAVSISVDAVSLSRARDLRQSARLFANGIPCGRLVITRQQPRAEVSCPAGALRAGDNRIRLEVAQPTRPVDLGLSGDTRRLGLGLKTLVVTAHE